MMRLYMQIHWNEDRLEQRKLLEDHGKFVGWFVNPELARKMEDGNSISVSDEDFEESWNMVNADIQQAAQEPSVKRRKRRKKVVNG